MTAMAGISLCGSYSSGNPFVLFSLYINTQVVMVAYCSIEDSRSSLLHGKMNSNEYCGALNFFILNLKYKTKFRIKAILNFDNLCSNLLFNSHVSCFFYYNDV